MSRVRAGGRAEALARLGKAQEFLEAARAALDARWHNAAASNAVTELRALGDAGRRPAAALDRLLGLKDRAQYDRRGVTASDAQAAVRRAAIMVEATERLLSQ